MSTAGKVDRTVFLQKWVGFVTAIWLMVFSGSYTFAYYSTAMKEALGINQKLLNGLAIARDVGDSCVGLIAGVASNYLPVWALLSIGASFGVLGYGIQWLTVSKTINPPYWVVFMAVVMSGSEICWMNVAIFTASVRNFARNCGPVSGLFKACMGLSAAVFFVLCDTFFSDSASMYLLMLMTISPACCLITAIFFRPKSSVETQEEQKTEQISLAVFTTMASGLAILIALLDLVPSDFKGTLLYKVVALFMVTGILVTLPFVPFLVLFQLNARKKNTATVEDKCSFSGSTKQREAAGVQETLAVDDENRIWPSSQDRDSRNKAVLHDDNGGNGLLQPLLDNNAHTARTSLKQQLQSKLTRWECCGKLPPISSWVVQDLGDDRSTLSLFKTWHFYILYFSLFCGCGCGAAFCNNLGQVGQSFGFDSVSLLPSLFSLGNFFGRLASGNFSEYFLRHKGTPRPVWMALTKVPMIAIFVWLSLGSAASLYVGSLVVGFCLGSLVTLTIPIVSEFYGLKHFGTNFMLTSTYFLSGSYVLSSLSGYLYDRQVVSGEGENSSSTCYGEDCYGSTFLIFASGLSIAFACDVVLIVISRPMYQKLRLVTSSKRG